MRLTIPQASQLCSENPAKVARISDVGTLNINNWANFNCLEKENLHLKKTFLRGKKIYENSKQKNRGEKRKNKNPSPCSHKKICC